jgi:probable phosphoglycerate mutase
VGRTPGVHLNETGRREADELSNRLASENIQRLFSSPLERCRETAEPLATRMRLKVDLSESLLEVNFGDWTGKTFKELESDERWRQWNSFRSGTKIPNGETLLEVQARTVGLILALHREFRDQHIALFSHGEPLRAMMIYFLGAPLDCVQRIDINPGSITILNLNDWQAQFSCINRQFGLMSNVR